MKVTEMHVRTYHCRNAWRFAYLLAHYYYGNDKFLHAFRQGVQICGQLLQLQLPEQPQSDGAHVTIRDLCCPDLAAAYQDLVGMLAMHSLLLQQLVQMHCCLLHKGRAAAGGMHHHTMQTPYEGGMHHHTMQTPLHQLPTGATLRNRLVTAPTDTGSYETSDINVATSRAG